MQNKDKLYKIINITGWKEHNEGEYPRPVVIDEQGNKHLVKRDKQQSRINEMIVTKACEKAGFDAVQNEFAHAEQDDISIISRALDYQIEPLGRYLDFPYNTPIVNAMNVNLEEMFEQHTILNDKLKSRFVDEVLLRSLFEDTDSYLAYNISVKKLKNATRVITDTSLPPLELSTSYDFNHCLQRDPKYGYSHKEKVTKNLKYIRNHYPQNAEKFFASFSFDNATLDELFDLSGAPEEWASKLGDIREALVSDTTMISKDTRTIFTENLAFLKDTFAKHGKKTTLYKKRLTCPSKIIYNTQ